MTALLTNQARYRKLPLHISSVGRYSQVPRMDGIDLQTNSISGAAWSANNRAVYHELLVPEPFTVARFWVANSNATGNIDVGLYDESFKRLISTGSQTRTGSSVNQYYGVTDQGFPAGRYYLGMSCSTTSGQVMRVPAASTILAAACAIYQEDLGSVTLPSTATPVAYAAQPLFIFGFTQSDSL